MPRKAIGSLSRRSKHKRGDDSSCQGIEMADFTEVKCTGQVFDSVEQMARQQMAQAVWDQGIKINGGGSLRAGNIELARFLDTMCSNSYRERTPRDRCHDEAELRIEAILSLLVRIQSQKKFTILCLRFSLASYRIYLERDVWQMIHAVAPGLLASFTWTEEFILYALSFRPAPKYETLPGVGACMFDNYTRQVSYKSKATTESSGYRLDMTNSMSMAVPRHCASDQFDAAAIGSYTNRMAHCSLALITSHLPSDCCIA